MGSNKHIKYQTFNPNFNRSYKQQNKTDSFSNSNRVRDDQYLAQMYMYKNVQTVFFPVWCVLIYNDKYIT